MFKVNIAVLSLAMMPFAASADELEKLLETSPQIDRVVESPAVKDDWHQALDLLAERKYQEASQKLNELTTAQKFITPCHRDFVAISVQIINYTDWLEGEKDGVRDAYSAAKRKVWASEAALNKLYMEEKRRSSHGAVIPPGTKQRIMNDRKRWSAELKAANATRIGLQKSAGKFEEKKFIELEDKVFQWINADSKGEDIETAYILATLFLDCVGDSDVIRKQSQRLEHKRSLLVRVGNIVNVIAGKVAPMVEAGKKDDARDELAKSMGRVKTSDLDMFVKLLVASRLQALFPSLVPESVQPLIEGKGASPVGKWHWIKKGESPDDRVYMELYKDGRLKITGQPTWSGRYEFLNAEQTRIERKCNNGRTYLLSYDKSSDTLSQGGAAFFRRVKE